MKNRLALLREIQEYEFAVIELALFLDNQPQERAALKDYQTVRDRYLACVKRYEEQYGPLTIFSPVQVKGNWQYIEGPWPWEIEYV